MKKKSFRVILISNLFLIAVIICNAVNAQIQCNLNTTFNLCHNSLCGGILSMSVSGQSVPNHTYVEFCRVTPTVEVLFSNNPNSISYNSNFRVTSGNSWSICEMYGANFNETYSLRFLDASGSIICFTNPEAVLIPNLNTSIIIRKTNANPSNPILSLPTSNLNTLHFCPIDYIVVDFRLINGLSHQVDIRVIPYVNGVLQTSQSGSSRVFIDNVNSLPSLAFIDLKNHPSFSPVFLINQGGSRITPNRYKLEIEIQGCPIQPYRQNFNLTIEKQCSSNSINVK